MLAPYAARRVQRPDGGACRCSVVSRYQGVVRKVNNLMFTIGLHATSLLLWGIILHLFCDWILQSDWQARYKSSLKHPAAYVHSGIHLLGLLLIFPGWAALAIALLHLLIDTRIPLTWWRRVYRQTREGGVALHVALWGDQVLHITVLALFALVVGGLR